MTDTPTSDDRLARLQQLQQRRAAAVPSPAAVSADTDRATAAKPHRVSPATGAKIATAGFFTATMFGIVGAMTITEHATSAATNTTPATPAPTAAALPTTTAPPKIIIVVHHVDANGKPVAAPKVQTGAANAQPVTTKPVVAAAPPIALTATPVIQRAPAAAAPVARTSGSRH